jgi:hypothetical protein
MENWVFYAILYGPMPVIAWAVYRLQKPFAKAYLEAVEDGA